MKNIWKPIEIDIKQISQNKNSLKKIINGESPALIIKNFYELENFLTAINRVKNEKMNKKIGVSLLEYINKKQNYFEDAEKARGTIRKIFSEIEDPRKKVHKILKILSGKNVEIAMENGQKFACGVIRLHKTGEFAQIHRDHVGHEAKNFVVGKVSSQLSSVLHLNPAEKGGELVIYKEKWKKEDEQFREIEFGYSRKVLKNNPVSVKIKPEQGDLVIINPIFYHEILPVIGEKTRITLGLFLGISKISNSVLTWS